MKSTGTRSIAPYDVTVKLYHGTTSTSLAATMRQGLRPRKAKASNWSKNPSRPDMVYLTTAYPFYFATMGKDDSTALVLEIDGKSLKSNLLYPDEDYVAYLAEKRNGQLIPEQRQAVRENLEAFKNLWPRSLMFLGTCAYRGVIPARAITRYCHFDFKARPDLAYHIMDACISTLNYCDQGRHYEQVVKWFFEDRKLLPMVDEAESEEERAFWLAQSKDRTGILVVVKEAKGCKR